MKFVSIKIRSVKTTRDFLNFAFLLKLFSESKSSSEISFFRYEMCLSGYLPSFIKNSNPRIRFVRQYTNTRTWRLNLNESKLVFSMKRVLLTVAYAFDLYIKILTFAKWFTNGSDFCTEYFQPFQTIL